MNDRRCGQLGAHRKSHFMLPLSTAANQTAKPAPVFCHSDSYDRAHRYTSRCTRHRFVFPITPPMNKIMHLVMGSTFRGQGQRNILLITMSMMIRILIWTMLPMWTLSAGATDLPSSDKSIFKIIRHRAIGADVPEVEASRDFTWHRKFIATVKLKLDQLN